MRTQVHLQNLLFDQLERILKRDIHGAELEEEIKRGLAANEMAKTIITNGALMVKSVDALATLEYAPIMSEFPLLPAKKILEIKKEEQAESREKGKMKLLDARTNREAV